VSRRVAVSRPVLAVLASVCALLAALAFSADPALATGPEAPVTLTPATEVTAESATLEGELNPHTSAEVTWEMFLSNPGGTSCHEGNTVGGEGPLDGQAIPVKTTARNLQPSSVYHFCVVAFHNGETSGNEETFKTLGAPGAPELSVQHPVGAAEANFQAVLRPQGEAGTHEPWPYHFLYKPGTSCVGGTETHYAVSNGEPDETVSERGFGLTPDTTYALCLVVTTVSETTTYGPISFTTHGGVALTVHLTGEGEVESSPFGIACETEQCFHVFENESPVTLSATPKPGYLFAGWLGCERILLGACEITPPARSEVTAVFVKEAEQPSVTPFAGNEHGCPGGGVEVTAGGHTAYLCNGTNGTDGTNGETGKEGPQGKEGSLGKEGPAGKVGAQGPAGPTGARGPAGPAGKVELVTCMKVKGKQHCKTKLVSGTVKFETAGTAAQATLSRHGVVYAAGTARTARGRMSLRLLPVRRLRPGKYTLTLLRGAGKHETIRSESFTLS
jgi:hypothetical protein